MMRGIFFLLLFQGFIVPDELGYLNNLGKYEDKDVVLQLPGYYFYNFIIN